ncbi:MAG TPA: permease prefix domain 1-containing protein [Verrucomicrobiae bacterium]|nr:permease prefix domain 1-containing protein [Verrucomicrobiae bacterium]
MKNQTRFNLNSAIENWRQELAEQPELSPQVRRELETHLRDTIAELQRRGLNDEESFWLARKRTGQPRQLCEEFAKADPVKAWRERAFWMVASVVAVLVWGSASNGLFAMLAAFLHPYYHFRSVSFLLSMLFYSLPVVWVIVLIANGRMARSSAKFALIFRSQLRLGGVATLLVVFSHLLSSLGNWWELRATGPIATSATIQMLRLYLSAMIAPLIFVGLLVWLMPTQYKRLSKSL